MGTILELQLPEGSAKAAAAFFEVIRRYETIYSHYRADSELKRLERTSGRWVEVSPVLHDLFRVADRFWRLSGGLLDVSLYPVLEALGTYGGEPLDAWGQLSARARSGFYFVQVDKGAPKVRLLKRGMAFDFGAIGKGYAVEAAVRVLRSHGEEQALVNFGGQITALGAFHGQGHRVFVAEANLLCELSRVSLCVSSNREHPAGHIYHPLSGRLVASADRYSVAIASSATDCDALSTIGFLDTEAALRVAGQLPGAYLLVGEKGQTWGALPPGCTSLASLRLTPATNGVH